MAYTWDAAGSNVRHSEEAVVGGVTEEPDAEVVTEQNTIELACGGDDLAGRRVEARYSSAWAPQTQATTLYYLRSSVLGGKVIAEVDATGGKRKGEVYLWGEELAEQQFGGAGSGGVVWKHHDPARSSLVESAAGGNATRRELDPLGQEVGAADPYALYGGSYGRMAGGDSLYAETGNPFNVAGGCNLDGMAVSCSLLNDALMAGAVETAYPGRRTGDYLGRQKRPKQAAIEDYGLGLYGVMLPNESRREGARGYLPGILDMSRFYSAPQSPAPTNQEHPFHCITANWFVNHPKVKAILNDYWAQTDRSGKENGGWGFYEEKTNTLHVIQAPEGEKAGMPNEPADFRAQMQIFRQNGQNVIFMFDIHTHPGGSGRGRDDPGNLDNVDKRMASKHAPIGIVVSGPGQFHFYDSNGALLPGMKRLDECL